MRSSRKRQNGATTAPRAEQESREDSQLTTAEPSLESLILAPEADETDSKKITWRKNTTFGEKMFAVEYIKNGNMGAEAVLAVWPYLTIGSAHKKASHLLKKDTVVAYMERMNLAMMGERFYNHALSKERVAQELMETLEECKEDGDRVGLLKTLDMICKFKGFYNHKQELDIKSQGIVINYINPDPPIDITPQDAN